ncbi:hypothetical protein EDM53_02845 [Rickettsiales endosymbiont of Peranema trichophorum]|uniref:ribonuclease T2 family protein n=1 Tax=Rickettsiales endosymbiont of Peranema trichophorum TaxID=2486577 RepID=UPI0010231C44|nr:hypothetical protein [Rickettsiales endosymbiont of Peranema trichophorum]RZI47287.1 hypothetical protein EDM53_02845 [Rickettsiales endosymbiont of Peranema trichophorum]
MKQAVYLLSCIIVACIPMLVNAEEPYCKVDSDKSLYYRLELSVPATFCKFSKVKDPTCESFPKEELVQLHGLWPNYTSSGFPEGKCSEKGCPKPKPGQGKFCALPIPKGLYNSQIWKLHSKYMGGREKCLERHEWIKHGLCTPMKDKPMKYFGFALKTTKNIVDALSIEGDKPMSQSDISLRIKEKLPELDGAVQITCRGKYASAISVMYSWGNEPGAVILNSDNANHFVGCKDTIIFPSKP